MVSAMRGLVLCVLVSWAGMPPAFAHALLVRADPSVGSTVAGAPPELSLRFSERVELPFTHVQVLDAKGANVATGEPRVSDKDKLAIVVGLPKLPAGTYTVVWHATSVDTHKTEGHFTFSVAP
jgi:methionine-rich copper-binding protein CopC